MSICAIIAVLVLQAYCDLSLPAYTSDIVNIGIQQGGIDTIVPKEIAKADMDHLFLFMQEDDRKNVLEDYVEQEDRYVIREEVLENDEKTEKLFQLMNKSMLLVAGAQSDQKEFSEIPDLEMIEQMSEASREKLFSEMEKQFSEMPETMMEQAATIYIKQIYQNLNIDADRLQIQYMLKTGGKMLALAFLGMAASVLVGFLASKVAASTGRDLRNKVFHKVVEFSNAEFDRFSTASLITRSTNDIQQIQMVTVMLLRMVLYAPIIGIGGVFKVFHTNVSMSWIIALAVALILMIVVILFMVAMPKFKILQNLVDRLNLVTREILTGLMVIRAFSTEKHEEERFDQANKDLMKTNLFVNRAMTFMMPIMMLVMNGISILIVWSGAHGINDGQMQVGDMMAFIQYTMQIIMAFLMICMISIMLPRAAISATRIDEILTSKTMICDKEKTEHFPNNGKGTIEFDHVSFQYPGAEENVLHDISFVAKPGETTAFIGSTGKWKIHTC